MKRGDKLNSELFFIEYQDLISNWGYLIFNKLDYEGTTIEKKTAYEEGLRLLETYELFCNNYGGMMYFKDIFINITWGPESEYDEQVMSVKDAFIDKLKSLTILIN